MSIRAYKLIEIKTEKVPTFNYNEKEITMLADDSNADILCFQKETLEEKYNTINHEEIKNILAEMIKECGDEDYVEYHCY